jgi:CubicO group peptidase (beta-lactamase class C family)
LTAPQVVIAIIERGELAATAGAEAIVPWWSFTKTVLAAAALTLVRDGAVALDRRIDGESYTLRQLLQHTAGLGDYGDLPDYHAAVARHDDPWSLDELLARSRANELRYRPGEGWRYSNIGYLRLGQLIERTTGVPLDTALVRTVLEPLGITGVEIARTRADLGSVDMGKTDRYHPGWVYHGLLVGPLCEATRLLDGVLGGALLPPRLIREMRTARAVGPAIQGRPFAAPGYGLGLMIDMTARDPPAGHTGQGAGTTISIYHRERDSAPIVIAAFARCDNPGTVERIAFGFPYQGRLQSVRY